MLLALGLTSCAGDDEPDPTTAPPATESTSPSEPEATGTERPEVEKPTPPDAMSRDDVAGAEAAAQYFLALHQYVYASGDLVEWKELSADDCQFCANVAEEVENLHATGGYAEGGEVTIDEVEGSPPVEGNDFFRVDVVASEGPSTRVHGTGDPTEMSGGTNLLIFATRWVDGGWQIREVQVEEPSFDG